MEKFKPKFKLGDKVIYKLIDSVSNIYKQGEIKGARSPNGTDWSYAIKGERAWFGEEEIMNKI